MIWGCYGVQWGDLGLLWGPIAPLSPQLWCAELFRLATNILHRNACRNTALRKASVP